MMSDHANETLTLAVLGRVTLSVGVRDLLGAPVDAIVNPANSGLSHGAGLAAIISNEAGHELDERCDQIIRKIGKIPVTRNEIGDALYIYILEKYSRHYLDESGIAGLNVSAEEEELNFEI